MRNTERGLLASFISLTLIAIAPLICWVVNLIQLVSLVSSMETIEFTGKLIIKAIGLIPYASLITVWF